MKVYLTSATCEIPAVVAERLSTETLKKRIIFCEDKFTLALELAVAKKHGGTFGTQVFSFNRFMKKYMPSSLKTVSTEGSALIVKGVLLEKKEELLCFKKVNEPNLASAVYELIAQLKSAKVTVADVERARDESEGNLKRKLSDTALIYSEYEKRLSRDGLTDGNNRLHSVPAAIEELQFLKDAQVFVVGFSSLNKSLCSIFTALYKNVPDLNFVIASGENGGVYTNEPYNFLTNNFKCELIREKSLPLREKLLGGLYAPRLKSGAYEPRVHFYRADGKYEEIENVAKIIRSRVLSGEKYKSFALTAEAIGDYSLTVRRVFADYEIPFFIDETKDLGNHPVTRLICSIIDFARRKSAPEDFLSIIKNPLFISDEVFSDRLENYVVKNAFSRRALSRPFVLEDDEIEEFESKRAAISRLSALFKENDLFSHSVGAVREVLTSLEVESKTQALGERLAEGGYADLFDYNAQAFERFVAVLDEAERLLGERKMGLLEVKNVILSGMTACKIALIPEFNDSVFVGDFNSVKYKQYKKVFAVGLTEDVPLAKSDCALLCDKEIEKLDGVNVLIEPKIKEVNRRAREAACMATACFSEELFLSYPSANGSACSEIIEQALKIFGCEKENLILDKAAYASTARRVSGEAHEKFLSLGYSSKRSACFSFARDVSGFKEGASSDLSAASAYYAACDGGEIRDTLNGIMGIANAEEKYYTENVDYAKNSLSTTAVEGFFNCPYSNFLSRGLKLKERENNDIAVNDLGSLMHEAAEFFVKNIDGISSEKEAKARASAAFSEIISRPEYSRYYNRESGKRAFAFVRREVVRFCCDLYRGCLNSDFKPAFIETAFGRGSFPPIRLDTRKGKVALTGKVDRVDVCEDKMRIVDYKTGTVTTSDLENNLYSGTKLQLFLYAKAFSEKYGKKTVGAYYFPVLDKFSGEGENQTMEMQGRTLADEDVLYLLDHTSRKGGGDRYVDAEIKYDKDGRVKTSKKVMTESDFSDYLEYAELVAAEGLSEIKEGVIIPSPYKNACEYCKYGGICGYDEQTDGRCREVSADRSDISAAVRFENESAGEARESDNLIKNNGGEE